MDVTKRFSNRVDQYIKYRPGYPAPLIDHLLRCVAHAARPVVADIGSGTGIFSSLLLDRGCRVYGVEPNDAMRRAAESLFAKNRLFASVNATAEHTGLPDNSVDLIVAAQAFHWFDPDKTRMEWRRILRGPGKVALIWNDRRTDTTPFLVDYEALLRTLGTDYDKVNHRNVDAARLAEFFGDAGYEETVFENRQTFDWDGLYGRALSSSYVPAEGEPGYASFVEGLRVIYDRHADESGVSFEYDTRLYLGALQAIN